jgi:organic radical activating enzyme
MDKEISCPHRWHHIAINFQNQSTNTCCKTIPYKADLTLKDAFLNNPYQWERRKELFNGIRYKGCNSCWQVEDAGGTSWRMYAYDNSNQVKMPNNLNSNYIDTLELTLGNTCDMKCVYCSQDYSTQWAIENYKANRITKAKYKFLMEETPKEFVNYFWNWFDNKKHIIRNVQVKGGEPLIMNDFYNLLEKIKTTDCNISVITNLNTPDKYFDRFLKEIQDFPDNKKFLVLISMDTVKEYAEYIRYGLSWEQFEKNIHKLYNIAKNKDNVEICFIITMTTLNLKTHYLILEYIYNLYKTYKKCTLASFNHVDYPDELNPYKSPKDFANFLIPSIDFIENANIEDQHMHENWQIYLDMIRNLQEVINSNLSNKIKTQRVTQVDKDRNLDHKILFPEFHIDK